MSHDTDAPTDDTRYMGLAIEASRAALAAGNMPFGASLVKDGRLLQVSGNNQVTTGDCTGHAEVALIREAVAALGREALVGATVYASGEPCAMCSGAMFWAGIRRVVFAATQDDIIQILGGPELPIRTAEVLATAQPVVVVEEGPLREEACAVLRAWTAQP